jgi:hypothetical protein
MPRSRTPLSSSSVQTALGMPPMPICRQAPSSISFMMCRATARSTSVGVVPGSSAGGAPLPSMTKSTSLACTPLSSPWQSGMAGLVSMMTMRAISTMARCQRLAPPKLNTPFASIGRAWMIATSTGSLKRR